MKVSPRMFPTSVQIRGPAGYDDYGQPVPGDVVTVPARIDTGERVVRSANGTEETIRVTVKVPGDVNVEDAHNILLPDYGERPIVSWRKILGAREVQYTEVYVS